MRIEICELPIEDMKECMAQIEEFRKAHPRTKKIAPQQISFLEDFAVLAKSKEGSKDDLKEAFKEIPTILLAGKRTSKFLSLSQAFALLMKDVPFVELKLYYQAPFYRILDKIYDRA